METTPQLTLLEIRKTFPADTQSVFDALTKPEQLNQWMYAMDEGSAEVTLDLKVGGKYSVAMVDSTGVTVAKPYGEILEIDPPNKLSMTWKADGFVDNSILTFVVNEIEDGTELVLTHQLPDPTLEAHKGGWATCLEHLQNILN